MYALVEWTLEGTFSIISLSAIVSPRKEYELYSCGETVSAKFQGKTYPARINKISGTKKELEKELLKPVPKSQTSGQELQICEPSTKPAERGDQDQKKSSGLKRKSGAKEARAKKQSTKTVDITDINEEEVEERISVFFDLNKEPRQVTPSKEAQESLEIQKPDFETTHNVPFMTSKSKKVFKSPKYIEESESEGESEIEEISTEMTPIPLAAKCPRKMVKTTVCNQEACRNLREEVTLLKERLGSADAECRRLKRICQELQQKQNKSKHQMSDQNKLMPGVISDRDLAREHKMVELVRGTFVFLYEDQLKIATEASKSMTGLARLLTDVFFSMDKQKKSNLSGENGLQKLDPAIVNAIITFSIACDQFKRQSPAEIRQSLRNKLGCLRAPSRQKKNKDL